MSSLFYWEVTSEIKPCMYPKAITKWDDYGGNIVNETSLKCQSTCYIHILGDNDAKHNTLSFQILIPLFFSIRHDEVQTAIATLIVEIITSSPSSAGETWMVLPFCPFGTYKQSRNQT